MARTDELLPRDRCTWCGHPPHPGTCDRKIRTDKTTTAPCPCARNRRAR